MRRSTRSGFFWLLSLSCLWLLPAGCDRRPPIVDGTIDAASEAHDPERRFLARLETRGVDLESVAKDDQPELFPDFGPGWEAPLRRDADRLWMEGSEARIEVEVLQSAPRDLEIDLWLETTTSPPPTLRIATGSHALYETPLQRGRNRVTLGLASELMPPGRHTVRLELSGSPAVPAPARALALSRFSLAPREPAGPRPGSIVRDENGFELPVPSVLFFPYPLDPGLAPTELLGAVRRLDASQEPIAWEVVVVREDAPSETLLSGQLVGDRKESLATGLSATETAVLELRFTGDTGGRIRVDDPRVRLAPRSPEAGAQVEPAPLVSDTRVLEERLRPRLVLLVILDAAAAHRSSAYGYGRPTTPVIEELAGNGLLFERAYAPSAYTIASTAALLTGLLPSVTGVVSQTTRLSARVPTLAETFGRRGWRTLAVVANPNAGEAFGVLRGFETRLEPFRDEVEDPASPERLHSLLVEQLAQESERPVFAYLHQRPPHSPYLAPPPHRGLFAQLDPGEIESRYLELAKHEKEDRPPEAAAVAFLSDRYDENYRYADTELGVLVASLRELGWFDDTLLIVTADHGEAFGEHGHMTHNTSVYEEMVRVPLVVHPPASWTARGIRIAEPVSTLDLFPTLFALARPAGDRAPPPPIEGQEVAVLAGTDLSATFLAGTEPGRRRITFRSTEWFGRTGLVHWPFKVIDNGPLAVPELYDLGEDPAESENLFAASRVRGRLLLAELRDLIEHGARTRVGAERHRLDAESIELLEALGYVEED